MNPNTYDHYDFYFEDDTERYMWGFEAYEQFLALSNQEAGGSGSGPKTRAYITREREEAGQRLIDDYFGNEDTPPKYTETKTFSPLFEASSDSEFNRIWASPPPKFKFMRDAEDKLQRKLFEDTQVHEPQSNKDIWLRAFGEQEVVDDSGIDSEVLRMQNQSVPPRVPNREMYQESYNSPAREFFYMFCWKNPTSNGLTTDTQVHEPQSNKDIWLRAFGEQEVVDDSGIDSEVLRMQNQSVPPRFLFTIKEETKEDLESEDMSNDGYVHDNDDGDGVKNEENALDNHC
nr:putative membrane lipoprotein [Tanacetum cinerariifolium]